MPQTGGRWQPRVDRAEGVSRSGRPRGNVYQDLPEASVLIAAPHALDRAGLRGLIDDEPGLLVCGEVGDCSDVAEQVAGLRPNVLLLDVGLPGGTLSAVLHQVHATGVPVKVLVLGGLADRARMVAALRAGAHGAVCKDTAYDSLFRAIRAVVADRPWVSLQAVSDLLNDLREAAVDRRLSPASRLRASLTPRELQAIAEVAGGATNREIARTLGVTEQTVKNLLTHIYDKVGVSSRVELAIYALHHGLGQPPEQR
jgi:DNA-binding NarL/FixJ family response regulator